MKVEIRIDPDIADKKIVIIANRMTPEIEAVARQLEKQTPERLTAYSMRGIELLNPDEVLRIYSECQKILVQTLSGDTSTLRGRLYEYENQLASRRFVRISNSEIVNGDMITGMDFSLVGTVCLFLKNDIKTYVSRRYVSRIKALFDI